MPNGDSPFMEVPASQWIAANRSAFVIADRFPVSPGHALVVPRRVIATWWEATDEERTDMLTLVDEVKRQLDAELEPDGYNVGFNAGEAAGQTVDHLHIHVIPRYHGDMSDPRGGVRHVIPSKGNYIRPVTQTYALVDGQDRLLRDRFALAEEDLEDRPVRRRLDPGHFKPFLCQLDVLLQRIELHDTGHSRLACIGRFALGLGLPGAQRDRTIQFLSLIHISEPTRPY